MSKKPEFKQVGREITITLPWQVSLEFACEVLAEGEHILPQAATVAGYAVIQWPGPDCPWSDRHRSAD